MNDPSAQAAPRGCVHLYTGDGKGKTTAAVGLAVRALGADRRVYLGQFCKKGDYAELAALEQFAPGIAIEQFGREGWVIGTPDAADVRAAREGLGQAHRVFARGEYDLAILDEALTAVKLGLLAESDLLDLLSVRPPELELVLTGRGASAALIEAADLVTEMREIKHYYKDGLEARRGIEY